MALTQTHLVTGFQIRNVVIPNQHIFHMLDLDFIIFVTSKLIGVVTPSANLKPLDITGLLEIFANIAVAHEKHSNAHNFSFPTAKK